MKSLSVWKHAIGTYAMCCKQSPISRFNIRSAILAKKWGIQNMDWVSYFLKRDSYLPIGKLLDKDYFFAHGCEITCPIMGAFTDYLISTHGIEALLEVYKHSEIPQAINDIYRKTPAELNQDFISYVRLFKIDPVLEKRMEELLA